MIVFSFQVFNKTKSIIQDCFDYCWQGYLQSGLIIWPLSISQDLTAAEALMSCDGFVFDGLD